MLQYHIRLNRLLRAGDKCLMGLAGLLLLSGCATTERPLTIARSATPASVDAEAVKAKQKSTQADDDDIYAFEDKALDAVTAPGLERFADDADFKRYRRQFDKVSKKRSRRWITQRARPGLYAMQDAELPCTPGVDCPEDQANDADSVVVVTGTKASPPKSITNNQTANVDEGDIVKQIGPFLLVLQDGRIFSVDTRGGTMKLADRVSVYRNADSDSWYDEMLVQDNRILITAYSYNEEASELSVFALNRETGKITPEGVFLITSDDYYDLDNYATRIVGDKLIIYTPYEVEDMDSVRTAPVIRRWLPKNDHEEERDEQRLGGEPLFRASDIHKPVQRTSAPTIHTLSICPLGPVKAGADLKCRSEAFIAPQSAEMFVSTDDIFLWTWPGWSEANNWADKCQSRTRASFDDVLSSAIFRVPVRGGEPTVIATKGRPFDQFSMDSRDSEFRALASWSSFRCYQDFDDGLPDKADVAYIRLPHRLFTDEFFPVDQGRITAVPSPKGRMVENRFADDWLVYGGRRGWDSDAPSKEDEQTEGWQPLDATVVILPVKQPENAKVFSLPQNIIRTERVGTDMMIVNGYHDSSGLWSTLFTLSDQPRIADRIHYPGRFESEGRSHAFNSNVEENGEGMFGIPTVIRDEDSGRWWWRSERSDLSFVHVSPDRIMNVMGVLEASNDADDMSDVPPWRRPQKQHPFGYQCEVSCVDWYGNTRPIFTDGRIFGLMETEIVEAYVAGGKIVERHRLDITHPVGTKAGPYVTPDPKAPVASTQKAE